MKYLILSLVISLIPITIGKQTIDTVKSGVTFEVMNMKINTVEGSFKGMKGDLQFDANDLDNSYFNATIDASTIDTDNSKRDEHLKEEDFFNVKKHKTIDFTSNAVVRSKKEGYFIAKGQLQIGEIAKEVKIPFTYQNGIFNGTLKINRLDYEIGTEYSAFLISEEVSIKIQCVTE